MTALKRLLILGLSLFVAGNLYAVVRLSEPPKARIEGLESNDEYMSLLYDARHLEEQEDSIKQVIAQNRKAFAAEPENRQQYGDVILNLEEELFDLRNRMGEVNDRINTIEQEWLIANMDAMYASRDSVSAADSVDTVAVAADSLAQDSLAVIEPTSSRLVSADAFRQVLSDADYDALQRAQDNELKVVEYINMLSENNMAMQTLDRQYAATQDAEEGARLYANYKVIDGLCRSLNDSIAQVWSTIFDAKSYAYSLLLETRGDEEQLDRNEEEYSAAMQQYAEDRANMLRMPYACISIPSARWSTMRSFWHGCWVTVRHRIRCRWLHSSWPGSITDCRRSRFRSVISSITPPSRFRRRITTRRTRYRSVRFMPAARSTGSLSGHSRSNRAFRSSGACIRCATRRPMRANIAILPADSLRRPKPMRLRSN